MHLWKCALVHPDSWVKKRKPVYAVAETKEKVTEYVNKHLRDGYVVGKVTHCGEQLAIYMYH